MLFAISWSPRPDASEERDKRTLALFSAWKPPAGFDFKGFYDYADGDGGMALVETNSAEVILEALAPWATFLKFSVRPVVPSETATPIVEKAQRWRESVR